MIEAADAAARGGSTVVGYLAYESAPAFDAAMVTRSPGALPLAWFAVFEADQVVDAPAPPPAAGAPPDGAWTIDTAEDRYAAAIAAIREDIARGRFYQINYTARLHGAAGDPEALFARLTTAQRAEFGAMLRVGTHTIVSASPELFFRRRGDVVETRPMKGTSPRGRWAEEDAELADRLRASLKERAENVMIVDLLRNDLGRVARPGSVQVPELFSIERYPTVLQMTSTVRATVRPETSLADLFRALFPCGSVTGAPKIEAMRGIAELEGASRGVYCGAIGVIEPGGDCAFSVAIRTVTIDDASGVAEYGTGGGITWDSTAHAEHAELWRKAAVLRADATPFSLVETLRIQDGRAVRGEKHLARLADSAGYFGWPDDVAGAARRALDDAVRTHPSGTWRARLVASEDGRVHTELSPLAEGEAGFATHAEAIASGAKPRTVATASQPVSSGDVFLFHKTTRRTAYEAAAAGAPGAWDVVLFNEDGELTELTRGNLVLELEGALVTPARSAGLLAGVLRQELLDAGTITERALPIDALRTATRLWFVNSLRGWVAIAPA